MMNDDLISREDTKQAIRHKFKTLAERCEINEVLNSMPSVQLKEKTGKWKQVLARRDDDGYILRDYKCTNCFGIILGVPDDYENLPRYCCMCGAKMEG